MKELVGGRLEKPVKFEGRRGSKVVEGDVEWRRVRGAAGWREREVRRVGRRRAEEDRNEESIIAKKIIRKKCCCIDGRSGQSSNLEAAEFLTVSRGVVRRRSISDRFSSEIDPMIFELACPYFLQKKTNRHCHQQTRNISHDNHRETPPTHTNSRHIHPIHLSIPTPSSSESTASFNLPPCN